MIEISQRFHRLTVIERAPKRGSSYLKYWLCRCDCGETKTIEQSKLTAGTTKSCGCFRSERMTRRLKTRGVSRTPEYGAWMNIRQRCLNPNNWQYHNYGGRGITICPEWVESFESFFAHVGRRPSPELSVERIDVNGNYEPGNVTWATAQEQARNRRPRKAA